MEVLLPESFLSFGILFLIKKLQVICPCNAFLNHNVKDSGRSVRYQFFQKFKLMGGEPNNLFIFFNTPPNCGLLYLYKGISLEFSSRVGFLVCLQDLSNLRILIDFEGCYQDLNPGPYCSHTIQGIRYQFFQKFNLMGGGSNNSFILFNRMLPMFHDSRC